MSKRGYTSTDGVLGKPIFIRSYYFALFAPMNACGPIRPNIAIHFLVYYFHHRRLRT